MERNCILPERKIHLAIFLAFVILSIFFSYYARKQKS